MKKWMMILLAICLSFSVVCLYGCGGSGGGSDEETEASSEDAGTQAVEESVWKAAYLEVLQADEQAIKAYTRADQEGLAALSDLNGDAVPELLYFVRDPEKDFPYMKIYTIRDGSAAEVSYEKPMAYSKYSDLPSDALYDYEVQGGTNYAVFANKDGSLQMYSFLWGAEFGSGTMNRYKMDAEGNLNQTERFGFINEFMNSMLEQPPGAKITFWMDGEEIQEPEYSALCDACTKDIQEVIFSVDAPNGAEQDKPIWDAVGKMTPTGTSYDQMITKLSE